MQYGTGSWNAKTLGNHRAVVRVDPRAIWIDWAALGLDPKTTTPRAMAIEDFQEAAAFHPDDSIPVSPGKGWLPVAAEARES